MLRRSSWRLSWTGAIVVALLARATAAQPSPHPPEQVRVTYEAPPDCPTEEVFLGQVRARVGTDWEAPVGVLARTIDVRISATEGSRVARIEFVDEQGQKFTRAVSATTCDEVVSGIALITALAIESRVAEALGQSDPAPADVPPAMDAKVGPPVAATPVVASPPRRRALAPARRPAPPARPHIDIGGAGLLGSGVGPALATGLRGFIGLGWKKGPDIRLGGDFLRTPLVYPSGVPTRFSLLGARASGCPVDISVGTIIRLLPCAGAIVGAHRGEGLGSNTVRPGGDAPGFFTPFVSLRAEVAWDAFFVELEGETKFPVDHHRFYFRTTPAKPDAYEVPPIAFGLSAGVGLRL